MVKLYPVRPRVSEHLGAQIKMCSDPETGALLNHSTYKNMIKEVTRKCVRIVRHTD